MYFKFSTSFFKSELLLKELLFEVLKTIQAFLIQTFLLTSVGGTGAGSLLSLENLSTRRCSSIFGPIIYAQEIQGKVVHLSVRSFIL